MTFDYPYAGLILPDASDMSPQPYLDSAAEILTGMDPRPDAAAPVARQGGRVMGRHLGIAVIPEDQSDYGPRMVLEVVTMDGTPPEDAAAARLLSATVRLALTHSSADILEWFAPDVLMDCDDFLRMQTLVTPHKKPLMSHVAEDALFETDTAAQAICGSLYPASNPVAQSGPDIDMDIPKPSLLARLSRLGLRRGGQMAAVTSLVMLLGMSGQMPILLAQIMR